MTRIVRLVNDLIWCSYLPERMTLMHSVANYDVLDG